MCASIQKLACSIKSRKTFACEPIIYRLDEDILDVAVVLNGIHVELLDGFRLNQATAARFPLPGWRTVTFDS